MQQSDAILGSASVGDQPFRARVRVGLRSAGVAHHQRMPDDEEPGFFSVRPKVLILIGAITGSLLMVALVVAWFALPRWAPAFVVEQSPWIGPAFEAAVHGGLESEFQVRLSEWGDGVLPAMCSRLGSRDLKRRKLAVDILNRFKDPRSVEPLIAALSEPDPEVLSEVMDALGSIGDQRASAPMIKEIARLAKHDVAMTRAAAFIVSGLAHPNLFDQVSATLLAPSQPASLQGLGCLALSGCADPRALTALEDRLGKTTVSVGRGWEIDLAGEALGRSHQPGSLAIIRRCLADGDADRRFGAAVAATHSKDSSLLEPLLKLTEEPELRMQFIVCLALAWQPQNQAISALGHVIEKGGTAGVFAAKALALNSSPAAVPMLKTYLTHPEAAIRIRVIDGLCRTAKLNPSNVEAVMRLADDPDPKVVRALKSAISIYLPPLTTEQREKLKGVGR